MCSNNEYLASEAAAAAAAAADEQEAIASAAAVAAAAAAAAAEAAVAAADGFAGPLPASGQQAQFQALHTAAAAAAAAAAAEEAAVAAAADADVGSAASRAAVPVVYAGPLPAFDQAQFQALHFAACNLTGRDPGNGCVVAIGRTRTLDLFGLWAAVRARGGHAGVTGHRQWADVSRALGASGPDNAWPGASVRLRQAYEAAGLLVLEQLLAAGVLLAPPPQPQPPQAPALSLTSLPGAPGLLQQQFGEQAVAEPLLLPVPAPPPGAAAAASAAASGGGAPAAAAIAARLARAQGPRLAPAAAAAAALEPGLLANLVGMPLAPEGPAQRQQQQHAQAEVEVMCGAVHGVLDVVRLRVACMCDSCLAAAGPYGHEMTLAQFQKHGGCAAYKNWKKSVQVRECGTRLGAWLQQQNVEVPFSNASGGLVKGRQAAAAAPQHAMQQLAAATAAAAVCGDGGTHVEAAGAQAPSNNLAGLAVVMGGAQSLQQRQQQQQQQQQRQLAPLSEASHPLSEANSGPALVGLPIAVCWDGCEFGATVEAFEEASGLHLVAWHGGDRELEALDLRQERWRLLAAGQAPTQSAGQQPLSPPTAPPDDSSLQHAMTAAAAAAPGLTPASEHHAAALDADDDGRPLRVVGASGQAEVAVRVACGSCIGTFLLQPAGVAAGTGTVVCHCDGCVAQHASTGQLRAWDLRAFERHGGMGRSRNARNSIKVLLPPDGSRRMTLGTWLSHFQQLAAAQAAREVVMQQQLAALLEGVLGPESLALAAAPAVLPAVSWPVPGVAAGTTTGPQQMDADAQLAWPMEQPPPALDAGAAAGGVGSASEQHHSSSEALPPPLLVSGVLQELASRKRARRA